MAFTKTEDVDTRLRDLGINRWLLYRSLDRICKAHGFDRATATFHNVIKAALEKALKTPKQADTNQHIKDSATELLATTISPRIQHQSCFPLHPYIFVRNTEKTDTTR